MLSIKRSDNGLYVKAIVEVVALIAFMLIAVVIYSCLPKPHQDNIAPSASTAPTKPKTTSVQADILFTGNTFWGRSVEEWSLDSDLKYAYPFRGLKDFDRGKYTAWISGLECPMKDSVHMTAMEQEAELQFNCSSKFLTEAKKWFTVFTLANNHTDNQGEDGFKETQQHLEDSGIQYFGHYDYKNTDDVCEVIALPVRVKLENKQTSVGKLPVALCGYHGVFGIPPQKSVDLITKYSEVMPVFAMPHMGAEYMPGPDQIKTDFYHRLIDAGADAVIADHPHWVQNTESYKGHLIAYSMGNFMFDQQQGLEVTRSAAIRVVMDVENSDALDKWLEIGETCKTYHDNCLDKINQAGLEKLSVNYKFDAMGTRDNNRLTRPANSADNTLIMQRLNWDATMRQLNSPYSKL